MASRKLPLGTAQSTRNYHNRARTELKAKIVEVAEQDPQHVLLHSSEAGDPYKIIGDIYDEDRARSFAKDWEIDTTNTPYLLHIKSLARAWPHLQYLADFMEVGTTPLRWKFLHPSDDPIERKQAEKERNERAEKTNVAQLVFLSSGAIVPTYYKTAQDLEGGLDSLKATTRESDDTSKVSTPTDHDGEDHTPAGAERSPEDALNNVEEHQTEEGSDNNEDDAEQRPQETPESAPNAIQFRLFVVEDLSRRVIEALGAKFDIDPSFFREHINDYAWYNLRDRFAEPPNLQIIQNQLPWFQIRWVRPRYFRTKDDFERARVQASSFNVLRRPDEDLNNGALLDDKDATVALTRTRASFWRGKFGNEDIGILLLDPTVVTAGYPLWRHYRNWEPVPSMHTKDPYPNGPPEDSLFDNVIHWTLKQYAVSPNQGFNSDESPIIPVQAFLHLVCAEWLNMISYLSTRLGQLEWEISFPRDFLLEEAADSSLKKLHVWRRLVPLYYEMLTETLSDRVFQFPPPHSPSRILPFHALRPSFEHVLSRFGELQNRLDRLTTIATAAITIAETRLSYAENKNLSRLTWLATFFIPLTFITGLLSIQPNIPELKGSLKYFFAIAIPLTVIVLGITAITTWYGEWISSKLKGQAKKEAGQLKFYRQNSDKREKGR
ncbi:hypothetical protein EJ08DRAFT_698396 [Tothia fuscella]|uniref:Uncharacterized protein n=1 Tax=Tothia fuscella TaxID=1048955 RepID=A0A9P4NQ24_9PEZI|nr:hypothetical protein EJ08DRAFT_698396 [Tothia fuscella]